MVADSPIVLGTDGDITFMETVFKGLKVLFELLTRRNVNTEFITKDDMKIHENYDDDYAHLNRYKPGGNINIT